MRRPTHELKLTPQDADIQRIRWERARKLSSNHRQHVGWSIGRGFEADQQDAETYYDTLRYRIYWENLMLNIERISKRDFYLNGGFANTRQFRRMRGGVWHYYFNHG